MTGRRRIHGVLIALCALGLTALLAGIGVLERLEWQAFDGRARLLRPSAQATDQVAVILIDEAAIGAMEPLAGRWPWPREVHADIIEFLALGDPRAIVFDILFTEQERPGAGPASRGDRRLVEATRAQGTIVHALQMLRDSPDEAGAALPDHPLPQEAYRFAVAQGGALPAALANSFHLPFDELYRAAAALGVVNVESDADGVHRRVPLLHRYRDAYLPGLGVAATLARDSSLGLAGGRDLPLEAGGAYLINPYGQIATYSMSGVLASIQRLRQGEMEGLLVSPEEFRDRVVFIGASAAGLEDLKATPLAGNTPGVMLHAATAANLLQGDILVPMAPVTEALVALVLVAVTVAFILGTASFAWQMFAPLALAGAYGGVSVAAFAHQYLMGVAAPLTAQLLSGMLCLAYLAFSEGRDRRRVRNMLAQYVSPQVLDSVMARYQDQLQAEVGAEENLTILFSDIRGFTALSESLPPARVVEFLNHYFSVMSEAILAHDGTINKFIGDAIMAFWGAPLRDGRHADKALAAAMEMQRAAAGVNLWLEARGLPPVQTGIGLHTGRVILGNIGSAHKLDYTIIGDNVNLASRLEGLTRKYGVPIVISQATREALGTDVPCLTLDRVRVKGKQQAIGIHAPIPDPERAPGLDQARLSAEAFAAYARRDWEGARALYARLPEGTLRDLFMSRCRAYAASPPPDGWDGVHAMDEK